MPNYHSAVPELPCGNFQNIIRRMSKAIWESQEIRFRFLGSTGNVNIFYYKVTFQKHKKVYLNLFKTLH